MSMQYKHKGWPDETKSTYPPPASKLFSNHHGRTKTNEPFSSSVGLLTSKHQVLHGCHMFPLIKIVPGIQSRDSTRRHGFDRYGYLIRTSGTYRVLGMISQLSGDMS